jgi:hypothetical protein
MKKTEIALSSVLALAACSETISPDDATCRQIDESTFEIVSTHDNRVIESTNDAAPYSHNPSQLRGTFNSDYGIKAASSGFKVDLNAEQSTCSFLPMKPTLQGNTYYTLITS